METVLGRQVVSWISCQEWTVYQEVQVFRGGQIADIVAERAGLLWVVEVKASLSLGVMDQAWGWKPYAQFVSVAVPAATRRPSILSAVLNHLAIGWLSIQDFDVVERVSPPLNRWARTARLKNVLTPEHKTFAEAGNSYGRRLTPWSMTCDRVRRKVRECHGLTLKELVSDLQHHYHSDATARSALYQWLRLGKVRGVEMRKEGNVLRLFPS